MQPGRDIGVLLAQDIAADDKRFTKQRLGLQQLIVLAQEQSEVVQTNRGAKVVVADNGSEVDGSGTSSMPAHEVVKEIEAAGGTALADTGDVSDWDQAQALINKPITAWGGLDILVNIAGNFRVNNVTNVTREDWDALLVALGFAFAAGSWSGARRR